MQDARKATGSLLMHPVACLNGTIIHISTGIVYSFLGYGSSRQEDKRMQRKTGNGYIRKIDYEYSISGKQMQNISKWVSHAALAVALCAMLLALAK